MIRRDWNDDWWLITQREHAKLALEFLREFQFHENTLSLDRALVEQTVLHHDDGWKEPDSSPIWGERLNRPVDFLDATPELSLPAWERGVEQCHAIDPQAGFWVSRHFTSLGMRVFQGDDHTETQMEMTREFLHEQSEYQSEVVAEIVQQKCVENQQLINETGYGILRSFDHLSLILTVSEKDSPATWPLIGYHEVTLTPVASEDAKVFRFQAQPWPFGKLERVRASAVGKCIPRTVTDQLQLTKAWEQSESVELSFELIR